MKRHRVNYGRTITDKLNNRTTVRLLRKSGRYEQLFFLQK